MPGTSLQHLGGTVNLRRNNKELAPLRSALPRMTLFLTLTVFLAIAGTCSATASCPACTKYLVSEVEDSQLTSSAYYCQAWDCSIYDDGTTKSGSGIHARLNATGFINGAWTAPYPTTTDPDYVQVNFGCLKVINAIAIKGRFPAEKPAYGGLVNQYVTKFKVSISNDCTNFTDISNGNSPMIFDGNTSPDDVVVRTLPVEMLTKCVRITPTEYHGHKALRFDVIGC